MNKLVVILGPTASGKTDLAIKLAKRFNGEVVSADSRQVYKGLNVGSGKITKKEMAGIPHYLLDVANPKRKFTVAQYQKLALKAIKNIQKKNKIPILVGGTGFYIQSIINGSVMPKVAPDWKLRKEMENKGAEVLFEKLKKIDSNRAKNIDRFNKRRLIRAIEIVLKTGSPVPIIVGDPRSLNFDILQIGILKSNEELKKSINIRLTKRLKDKAMINEVKKLHSHLTGYGLSWKRLEEFGLEYRFVAQYLQNKITYEEMIDKIQKESEHYAKRQMTWFKRDKRIIWIKNDNRAIEIVDEFINK